MTSAERAAERIGEFSAWGCNAEKLNLASAIIAEEYAEMIKQFGMLTDFKQRAHELGIQSDMNMNWVNARAEAAESPLEKERLSEKAMDLLRRAAEHMEEQAPDQTWWREYFLLTGQHMILTDNGWEDGSVKATYVDDPDYGPDYILDEVNAPAQSEGK